MKQIVASRTVDIPEGITLEVKARKVRVKGPRGAPGLGEAAAGFLGGALGLGGGDGSA